MIVKGTIINHNQSFKGEMVFNEMIESINNIDGLYEDYIIPGFVDLHCHGGNGFEVMEGWNSITELSKYHLLHGTTSITPTTWTETLDKTYSALKGYNEEIDSYKNIIGIQITVLKKVIITSNYIFNNQVFVPPYNTQFITVERNY